MWVLAWILPAISVALIWPKLGWGAPIFAWIERKFSAFGQRRWLAIVAVGTLTIIVRLALLPWLHVPQPKVHDEFSYLLAADTFAHLRLANPPHPMWIFFDTFHVLQHPTYASMYPPGQGFALALGQAFTGQPWIGVVLSVAAMCMAFTWMLQGWVSPEWALVGGVLVWARFGVFSYWMNSYWGGAVAATGAALVLGALARIWDRHLWRDAVLFGLGAGILAIARPAEGALFFIPYGAALLWWVYRMDAPVRATAIRHIILPIAVVLVCAVCFVGFYNWRVTGNALIFPHFIEGKLITSAVFLWQHDKPPIAYSNPQFEDFYRNFLPSLYQASWAGAVGQWWYKSTDFWEFFLGPALSMPFLALPWVLWKKPRSRLLLVQFALSALGLWIVVYYHAHYAAPLMATLFVLLMQSMREVRRLRILGYPVGVGLTRMIVLFSLLVGPVYFAEAASPRINTVFERLDGQTIIPLVGSLAALMLIRAMAWSSWLTTLSTRAWLLGSFEFLIVVLIVLQLCAVQKNLYCDAFPYVDDVNETFRKPVEDQLAALPGRHLVVVCYSKGHNSGEEYVYNAADIDRAKIVWAREIPGMSLDPLFQYFRNRDVWLYEPDKDDSTAQQYAPDDNHVTQ